MHAPRGVSETTPRDDGVGARPCGGHGLANPAVLRSHVGKEPLDIPPVRWSNGIAAVLSRAEDQEDMRHPPNIWTEPTNADYPLKVLWDTYAQHLAGQSKPQPPLTPQYDTRCSTSSDRSSCTESPTCCLASPIRGRALDRRLPCLETPTNIVASTARAERTQSARCWRRLRRSARQVRIPPS